MAAVVGDGEESESRLLVGVSSLERLALSPREGKNSMNFQTHTQKRKKKKKHNFTNNYTASFDYSNQIKSKITLIIHPEIIWVSSL